MIELIYNEEESSAAEEERLWEPKNVKQIGEPREYKKIFIEDFVDTYLQQYSHSKGCQTSVALLLGKVEGSGGKRHVYITSALPVEQVTEKQGKYLFTESLWSSIYQECERHFPDQEIMGWFLARPGFSIEKNGVIEETHRTYFSGAEKILLLSDPLEKEAAVFGFDGNRFGKQSGYYIYYEKNPMMREFMMGKKDSMEKPDIAMANFRRILKEKKDKKEKRKKIAISYGTKVAIALVAFVGLVSITSEETPMEVSTEEVLVEELPGNMTEEVTEEIMEEVIEEVIEELPVTYVEYIVQKGDTLVSICRNHYGTEDMVLEVCQLNGIENGDYIQAGEIILLP